MANPLLGNPPAQTQGAPPPSGGNPLLTQPPANPFLDPQQFRKQHGMADANDPLGNAATKAAGKLVTGTSKRSTSNASGYGVPFSALADMRRKPKRCDTRFHRFSGRTM